MRHLPLQRFLGVRILLNQALRGQRDTRLTPSFLLFSHNQTVLPRSSQMMRKSMSTVAEPRGLKRKRVATLSEDELVAKLSARLHQGFKTLQKTAKNAKAFEKRKMIKRAKELSLKDASSRNKDEIKQYEEQMEILRPIPSDALASAVLTTRLQKESILWKNQAVQTAFAAEIPPNTFRLSPEGTLAIKVERRLLSSKIMAGEIKNLLMILKHLVNARPEMALPDEMASDNKKVRPPKKVQGRSALSTRDGDHDDSESEHEDETDLVAEAGPVQDDVADGWESGSIDDANPRIVQAESSSEASSVSEDDDDDDDRSPPASSTAGLPTHVSGNVSQASKVAKDAKGNSRTTAESTFLPSLSVGFTRGDSDASDWSDGEANVADVRKNRRGQRARRAIWEKKFGKNANHVKKERETAAQEARTNPKRLKLQRHGGSAHYVASRGKGALQGARALKFAAPPSDKGWSQTRQPTADRPIADMKPKQDDKPLHPSWEAKRRLKEKFNPSILQAQGTKITF